MSTYLWARGPNNDVVQMQYMLLNAANMPAASYPVDGYADISVTLVNTYQHFTMVSLLACLLCVADSAAAGMSMATQLLQVVIIVPIGKGHCKGGLCEDSWQTLL